MDIVSITIKISPRGLNASWQILVSEKDDPRASWAYHKVYLCLRLLLNFRIIGPDICLQLRLSDDNINDIFKDIPVDHVHLQTCVDLSSNYYGFTILHRLHTMCHALAPQCVTSRPAPWLRCFWSLIRLCNTIVTGSYVHCMRARAIILVTVLAMLILFVLQCWRSQYEWQNRWRRTRNSTWIPLQVLNMATPVGNTDAWTPVVYLVLPQSDNRFCGKGWRAIRMQKRSISQTSEEIADYTCINNQRPLCFSKSTTGHTFGGGVVRQPSPLTW